MNYKADSPEDYISQLPPERQPVVSKLRAIISKNLPKGFKEQMSYGMLGFVVPHSLYPDGYHCDTKLPLPFINLASQKNFIALYHSGIYADSKLHDWFVAEYPNHVKTKLDMGKSCIRFKKMETVPYELIGKLCTKMTVKQWISVYQKNVKNK
jgi:uncharacterized protein YdhG (YjbR/CyaY superfamily)